MKTIIKSIYISAVLFTHSILGFSQDVTNNKVIITGARFSYPIVEKWIAAYKNENPNSNLVIEARTTLDPAQYDLLIEAYEPDASVKETREYLYVARYVLLPVANASSNFAKAFAEKGLNKEWINQIYFSDVYANKKDAKKIDFEYTVYTRLQKAGAPITFAKYFGFEQANIKGKAISGADEHLIKALLKDTTGVSYSVPGLLYNLYTRKQVDGLTIIPVDTDGNGRVSSDERFYDNLDKLVSKLEESELKNIPTGYLHLSIARNNSNAEARRFLQWLGDHSQEDLTQFGLLKPDPTIFQKGKDKLNKPLAFH